MILFRWLCVTVWFVFPVALSAQSTFICPPCGLDCDTLHFTEAGDCRECAMILIQATSDTKPSESPDLLQQLIAIQKEKGKIQPFLTILSDRYGPRLLGSKTYAEALEWMDVQLENAADSIWYHDYDGERYRSW